MSTPIEISSFPSGNKGNQMLGDEGWHMIRNMAENGMRISDIVRELNLTRKTVMSICQNHPQL
ncbi:MAG: helix-turn-helix domain-containing protein [Thermoplasmatales archaeon]